MPDTSEIAKLFSEAAIDIQHHGRAEIDIEIHPELDKQQIQLLFTTAEQALIDPSQEKRWEAAPKVEAIESKTIAATLAQVEQKLEAPAFGLKDTPLVDPTQIFTSGIQVGKRGVVMTPWSRRFAAALVDSAVIGFVSCLIAFTVIWFFTPALKEALLDAGELSNSTLLAFSSLALATFSIVWPFYYVQAGEQSRGQKLLRISVVGIKHGSTPRHSVLTLRAILVPLSVLLAPLLVIWRGRLANDQLTGTVLAIR